MNYRIEVLRNGIPIGSINAISGDVKFNSAAKIMRAASITCDDFRIKFYADYKVTSGLYPSSTLFPSVTLYPRPDRVDMMLPKFSRMGDRISPILIDDDGNEYRQGKLMIVSAPGTESSTGTTRTLELYDETYILEQSTFPDRLYFAKGTKITDIVNTVLGNWGFSDILITASDLTTSIDREFAVGTNVLDTLNKLLAEINYEPIHINQEGCVVIRPVVEDTMPGYVYRKDENCTIISGLKDTLDIYDLPNVFIGICSTPDKDAVITYKRENHNLGSDLSIENRGYRIVKTYKPNDISSADALEMYINTLYNDTEAVLETESFTSQIEPDHDYKNTLQLETDSVSGLFTETAWQITFGTMSQMVHSATKKVML